MSTREFNLNQYVWVKLTVTGEEELARQHKKFADRLPNVFGKLRTKGRIEDGYERFQLWDLINRLGHLCHLGCFPPFETTIRLEFPEESENPQTV